MTWLLQVMPLFFFVGGWAHTVAIARYVADGQGVGVALHPAPHRLARSGPPWPWRWPGGCRGARGRRLRREWTGRAVLLILSPLWFLAVYVRARRPAARSRPGCTGASTSWCSCGALGLAALVDVGRFRYGWDALGWFNMILVWGLCHQLGFFYDRLVRA